MAKINIVLFPFLAQGHMIPFLELAKLLEQQTSQNHHSCSQTSITLLSTPLNIQNLKPLLTPSSKIHLQSIPFFPSTHNLPRGTESTESCHSASQILNLNLASRSLQPQFENFIIQHYKFNPTIKLCVISDVFLSWTISVCKKYSVPNIPFTTCGAFGTATYMSMWLHLPHKKTNDEYFRVPGFPKSFKLHRTEMSHYVRNTNETDGWYKFMFEEITNSIKSNRMICNTIAGLEPLGLQALKAVTGASTIYTVGPLVPESKEILYQRAGTKFGIERAKCIKWLDQQEENSVLYISFGSQNSIGASQILALAQGLESSHIPFVWVIRPPHLGDKEQKNDDEDDDHKQMQKWLPKGYIERITHTNQGLLIWKWAPQLEIITHKATGAFLSHCGWNSILESFSRGVPLVAWPLAAEQFYNAKMLREELRVSVEMNRGESELEIEKVVRVVKEVMRGERGKEIRENAAFCKEIVKNAMKEREEREMKLRGSSLQSIDQLIDFFINY